MDLREHVVDVVVLAGGEGRRLGGVDKAAVVVAGRPMLEHVLNAVRGARHVVVVGPANLDADGYLRVQEDPPHGGPAAGLAAGLAALDDPVPLVLVLACDQPMAGAAIGSLLTTLATRPDADGAVLRAADGRRQTLLAIYRTEALQTAVARAAAGMGLHGASMRSLVAELSLLDVPDTNGAAQDGDTWQDVESLSERMRHSNG